MVKGPLHHSGLAWVKKTFLKLTLHVVILISIGHNWLSVSSMIVWMNNFLNMLFFLLAFLSLLCSISECFCNLFFLLSKLFMKKVEWRKKWKDDFLELNPLKSFEWNDQLWSCSSLSFRWNPKKYLQFSSEECQSHNCAGVRYSHNQPYSEKIFHVIV